MQAKIALHNLQVQGILGIYSQEQEIPRPYLVDLQEWLEDIQRAVASDQITKTVDYALVADLLVKIAAEQPFGLIEKAASTFLDQIFASFPMITECRILVRKPGVPQANSCASVEILAKRHGIRWKTLAPRL